MTIKVCHFSDWHGHVQKLPEADLYVCTGDMLSSFPVKDRDAGSYTYRSYVIDRAHEVDMQTKQVNQFVANGGFRPRLGSPDAPIVCVRGNHDFIDLAGMFDGCNFVHEFVDNELLVIEALGLKITGHRGIPWIYGTWNDEVQVPELIERCGNMPEADLFLTHYPPNGMLDSLAPPGTRSNRASDNVGLEGMMNIIIRKVNSEFKLTDDGITEATPVRAAHCFGHIHEWGGHKTQAVDIMFSNAAQTINVFDIEIK